MTMSQGFTVLLATLHLAVGVSEGAKIIALKAPAETGDPASPLIHRANSVSGTLGGCARVIADYPTFELATVNSRELGACMQSLKASGVIALEKPTFDEIRVNGYTFPSDGPPSGLPSWAPRAGSSARMYLVQFIGPSRPEWLAFVEDLGDPIGYLPDNTFLVRMSGGGGERARQQAFVQHVSPYEPAYKIARDLAPKEEAINLTVQIDEGQDASQAIGLLGSLGAPVLDIDRKGSTSTVGVVAGWSEILALAALPEVLWIERRVPPQISDERAGLVPAGRHNGTSPTNPGTYQSWLASKGFCTSTSRPPGCYDYWNRVAVFDSGLDVQDGPS